MKWVGLTMRVVENGEYKERRDAIDQRWISFVHACGFLPVMLPNCISTSIKLCDKLQPSLIILTGGNSLLNFNGDAPERDEMELALIKYALDKGIPILGVCRGMQLIQQFYGLQLRLAEGHVTPSMSIMSNGNHRVVNSFHDWGTTQTCDSLKVWAKSEDGIVKAIKHVEHKVVGIMWHPERYEKFHQEDIDMVRELC